MLSGRLEMLKQQWSQGWKIETNLFHASFIIFGNRIGEELGKDDEPFDSEEGTRMIEKLEVWRPSLEHHRNINASEPCHCLRTWYVTGRGILPTFKPGRMFEATMKLSVFHWMSSLKYIHALPFAHALHPSTALLSANS
jgi:hypothetical protein